jgi:amino acid transporter
MEQNLIAKTRVLLLGPPLPTQRLAHERLNKVRALATFSPDALSSIAYANHEIFLGLALAVIGGPQETILSALARRLLGSGPAYVLVQISTMLVLAVAANTSFAGFPRVAALLADDGFLPHQLSSPGDRLVFANGVLVLAAASGGLIVGSISSTTTGNWQR